MSVNERALRAALDGIAAALDGLYALLPDEDDASPEPEPATVSPPAGVGRPCKHTRREPMGGFGGVAVGWHCNDCGAEGTGG